ncbi:MAG: stage III sporulation protein AD [Bacillota bacterium]|nr:stage III sporulation protein AD [Candidatus Fermentithermobacillaceae bacterium]HAF67019.1 stage III sporulation protein AD [Clostridiales bacterium UBA9857]HOA70718.1 stage III sporulation protein AD [Bacillota bacterium]HOP71318.1 stage III sporulation protein AD [Bacillota bacterium]HPT36173.1 stage III sporulation protein AD [Bacillota bacterium]
MDIFQIVILGITASLILLILRRERPELALVLSMAAGAAILVAVLPGLRMVITAFSDIAREAGVGPLYFGIILKVVAIAYIADLGASICRDADENLIASRIEMAGKILILVCSIPIIQGIVELIRTLLA